MGELDAADAEGERFAAVEREIGGAGEFEAAAQFGKMVAGQLDARGLADVVRVSSDGASSVDTVPESFARWRLPAGSHRLAVTWSEGSATLDIAGAAGEVVFVEVIGSVWMWGSNYRLERGDAAESRQRAMPLRLVADVG